MSEITTMEAVDNVNLEKLKESKCYGIAYYEEAPECRICEMRARCRQVVLGVVTPRTVIKEAVKVKTQTLAQPRPLPKSDLEQKAEADARKAAKEAAEKAKQQKLEKPKKPEPQYSKDLPVLVNMEMADMYKLAEKRGVDKATLERIKGIASTQIQRMQLTMKIKKTYLIK